MVLNFRSFLLSKFLRPTQFYKMGINRKPPIVGLVSGNVYQGVKCTREELEDITYYMDSRLQLTVELIKSQFNRLSDITRASEYLRSSVCSVLYSTYFTAHVHTLQNIDYMVNFIYYFVSVVSCFEGFFLPRAWGQFIAERCVHLLTVQ